MITYEVRLDATGSEETFFWADTDLDYAGSIWEETPRDSSEKYVRLHKQIGKIYRNSYQLIIVLATSVYDVITHREMNQLKGCVCKGFDRGIEEVISGYSRLLEQRLKGE